MIRTANLRHLLQPQATLTSSKLFLVACLAGLILRVVVATQLPFTFDEGAYLYDGKVVAAGQVPAGDALTKSPIFILLLAFTIKVWGNSLWVGRTVAILASLATAGGIYVIGWRTATKNIGRMAAAIWLLAAGPINLTSYGNTHSVALAFATWAVALIILNKGYALAAGVVAAAAYASRKTMIALALPMSAWWYLTGRSLSLVGWFVVGVGMVSGLSLGSAYQLYGWPGVHEASGVGYGMVAQYNLTHAKQIIAWGGNIERFVQVFVLLLGPLIVVAIWGTYKQRSSPLVILSWLWLLATLGLYSLWPAALPEYLADLLPPLVLLAALGFAQLPLRRVILSAWLVLNIVILTWVVMHPWTGWYSVSAIRTAAQELRDRVPVTQPILTAAAIIPYFSGHSLYRNISHPLWYTYAFIPVTTQATFLPAKTTVKEDFLNGKMPWILTDALTNYVYFLNFLPLPDGLPTVRVPNTVGKSENPLELWHRN